MLLLVAATAMELDLASQRLADLPDIDFLQAGVGILETTVNLAQRLQLGGVTKIINFGVCGAYLASEFPLLHICVAKGECVADLGIFLADKWQPLSPSLPVTRPMEPDPLFLAHCQRWLADQGHDYSCCSFATVNGVSGTGQRGNLLAAAHNVCCENMEGAAVARLAGNFAIPWLEIRCVSNQVADRNETSWCLAEASKKCADLVSSYCCNLLNSSG